MDIEDNCSKGEFQSHCRLEFEDVDDFDELCVPIVGMEFETEEAAYQFYNAYAYKVGFSVRRSKEHKDRSGKIVDRLFCCSCEGKREKDKRDLNVKCHRPETRFGCLAKMKVNSRVSGKFRVVKFVAEHNHAMCSPSEIPFSRSHRNSAPKAAVKFMDRQVGGRDNLGGIDHRCKNYLRSKRTVPMKMGDTGAILQYLQKMQLEDPNFFYAIQVDEDDLITNIFWVDAKMMEDYSHFGDVVCFDTTYRKNKEGRPFAMFVGVNHHKQATVFGAALLYDESSDTFMWLFDTFAKAMCGKTPKTILTDQDPVMVEALATEWPETSHRLCISHIYHNAAIELGGVFERFEEFSKDFSDCLYKYEDEDDFISAWNAMLEKYSLQDDNWLGQIYDMKEKWALVYGRQCFCADIAATLRNDSMNSVIGKYLNYKHDLQLFFHHFQRLIDHHHYEVLKADGRASQSTQTLSFPVEILKHAASIYTPPVFELFQAELCKAFDSSIHLCGEGRTLTEYRITPYRKHYHHVVTYDSSDGTMSCSCKKFEFVGILCAHVLKVLSLKNVLRIPNQYTLKRWTKSARSGIEAACANTSQDNPKVMIGKRYKELCRLCTRLEIRAAETEKAYKTALDGLNKLLEVVDASLEGVVIEGTFLKTSHANRSETASCDGSRIRTTETNVQERTSGRSRESPRSGLERAAKKQKSQVTPFSDGVNSRHDPCQ